MSKVVAKTRHRTDVGSGVTYVYLTSDKQTSVLRYAKKFLKDQHKRLPFEAGEVKIYDTKVDVKMTKRGRIVPVSYSMTIRLG